MEKIEVVYREIGFGYYHKYLLYTNVEGDRYAASGWAEKNTTAGLSDFSQSGASNSGSSGSDFGKITTTHGKYNKNYPDHPEYFDSSDQARIYEDIFYGADLSDYWKKITDAMDDIAREKHQYRPLDQNSNSTADEALRRAGLCEPEKDSFTESWSPGSGNNLPGGPDDDMLSEPWVCDGLGVGRNRNFLNSFLPRRGEFPGGSAGGLGRGGAEAAMHGSFVVSQPFESSLRRDPLALEGDGSFDIETTSIWGGTIVLFDHDGDGLRTGTGWLQAGDSWLVMDRNGNGRIDSGRELFGADTLKRDGQLASDGFDALRQLDTKPIKSLSKIGLSALLATV